MYANFADGSPLPYQVNLAKVIRVHGVLATCGKETLTARELKDLNIAEVTSEIIEQLNDTDGWDKYAKGNPQAVKILDWMAREYRMMVSNDV